MKRSHVIAAMSGWFALAGVSGHLSAQTVRPGAPSANELAKYDRNNNGRLDPDELAAMQADETKAAKLPVGGSTAATASGSEDIVQLSPFEVVADNKGYYAANTMSGTRLNSKLDDLASAITVVTKEQMSDFAMLDINDIFTYEAGVEGSGTFTLDQIDRNGSPYDLLSQTPESANRMRGLAPANISLSNFETSGRVPIDPINIDAVEINRGPNSNIFGIGSAGGSVNMVGSTANASRDRTQVGLRADSYDGYRGSLDFNRVLVKNKLAIRANGVFQHDGFVRKPSGVDTKRYNGMVRYQPFKTTSLTAGYSYYHFNGNRPNTTPPTDAISDWVVRGAATWDPITRQIRSNGVVVSTATAGARSSTTWGHASGPRNGLNAQPSFFIGPDQQFMIVSMPAGPGQNSPALLPSSSIRLMESAVPSRSGNTRGPLYARDPSVSNKALYDWTTINDQAVNFADDKTETYNVTLEQTLLNSQRQLLAMQLSWFREDSERYQHYPIGTGADGGAFGALAIDVNEKLTDGRPNPFFLHPFMGTLDARDNISPYKRDSYRAQFAYRLDLTREKNLLRWLGLNQVAAYREVKETKTRSYSYRIAMTDTHAWLPANHVVGSQGGVKAPYFKYYLGDGVGYNVDYAPTQFQQGVPYPFQWFDGVANQWNTEPVVLGKGGATDTTTSQRLNILKTQGITLQSHLWNDRIVPTVGQREDKTLQRRGGNAVLLPDGVTFDWDTMDAPSMYGDYISQKGKTKTFGLVVRPFREMSFLKRLSDSNSFGRFVAGALGSLSFSVNKSDNFSPSGYRINLLQEVQPNQMGKGEDYGVGLTLFDGKLHVRAFQSKISQLYANGRSNSGGVATRFRNIEFDPGTAWPWSLWFQSRQWMDWQRANVGQAPLTDAEFSKAFSQLSGYPENWNEVWRQYGVTETDDTVSKSREIEINYNPRPFWTMKLNYTNLNAYTTRVSDGGARFYAQRLPVWEKIIDPRDGQPWYTSLAYKSTESASIYVRDLILSPYKLAVGLVGVTDPQIRRNRVNYSTNFRLSGITENRILKRFNVGGSVRWEDKGAIGFGSVEKPPLQATTLNPFDPIFDQPHYYADLLAGYRTRILKDRVGLTLQLNVRNIQEAGSLRPIRVFPDGTPNTFRIMDPRQFILTATLDL